MAENRNLQRALLCRSFQSGTFIQSIIGSWLLFSSGEARFTFKKFWNFECSDLDEGSISTLKRLDATTTVAVDNLYYVNTSSGICNGKRSLTENSKEPRKIVCTVTKKKNFKQGCLCFPNFCRASESSYAFSIFTDFTALSRTLSRILCQKTYHLKATCVYLLEK